MTIPMPVEISDATLAFPASALEFMPEWEEIPKEFQTGDSPWCDLQHVWFYDGMSQRFSFIPKEIDGVKLDPVKVYRQLQAIQGTFACKHQHKRAAVSYLASLWMDSVIYGPPDTPDDQLRVLGETPLEEWLEHFAEADTKEAK